jgi:hypothetical protein
LSKLQHEEIRGRPLAPITRRRVDFTEFVDGIGLISIKIHE